MSGDDCLNIIGAGLAECEIKSQKWINPPNDTSHRAFLKNITKNAFSTSFQAMNINFGLFPRIYVKNFKKFNTFEKTYLELKMPNLN